MIAEEKQDLAPSQAMLMESGENSTRNSAAEFYQKTVATIQTFREKREQRQKLCFLESFFVGALFTLIGFSEFILLTSFFIEIPFYYSVPGMTLGSWGLYIIYTIPPDYWDHSDEESCTLFFRMFYGSGSVLYSFGLPRSCSVVGILGWIVGIPFLFKNRYDWDRIIFKLYAMFPIHSIIKSAAFLYSGITVALNQNDGKDIVTSLHVGYDIHINAVSGCLIGAVRLCICAFSIAFIYINHTAYTESQGIRGKSPTAIFHYSFFMSWFGDAFKWFICGTQYQTDKLDYFVMLSLYLLSAAIGLPCLIFFAMGEKRVYAMHKAGWVRSKFDVFDTDQGNLVEDGAFISQLLDQVTIGDFETLWLHFDKCGRTQREEFPTGDHRRNWYEARVVKRDHDKFGVVLSEADSTSAEMFWVNIQLSNSTTSDSILAAGLANLRCIDWEVITEELFMTSVRDASTCSLFDLSRPVKQGERIDYFISHSWSDDGRIKYQKLKEIAENFQIKEGRSPTFWFDKVCIDQKRIIEGLRVLPINVMACRDMLILCSETYCTRLWCIWELFTLTCFASTEIAASRIVLCPLLETQPKEVFLASLKAFSIDSADCYDPNERRKLLAIINANGTQVFEQRVSELAQILLSNRLGRKSLSMSLSLSINGIDDVFFSNRRRNSASTLSSGSAPTSVREVLPSRRSSDEYSAGLGSRLNSTDEPVVELYSDV